MLHSSINKSSEYLISSSGSLVRSKSSDDNFIDKKDIDIDNGITDRITCYRPKYQEGLIIKQQIREDDLFIIDNLGHSGSGWTIGPGTADKSIDILMKKLDDNIELRNSMNENGICIIGAGCIGMFTAIMLKDRYKNAKIKIIAEELENTTSHNAGGLISVTCLDNDRDKNTIEESALSSYDFYKDISKYLPELDKNIVREIRTYFSDGYDDGVQLFFKKGKINKAGPYNITFPSGKKIDNVYKYNPLFIQTDELMRAMRGKLNELDVEIINRRLNNFADIKKIDKTKNIKIIFNCSGLGINTSQNCDTSNTLNNNYNPQPIIGHMIRAKLSGVEQLNGVFVLKIEHPLSNTPDYVHRLQLMPKIVKDANGNIVSNYMIGGTFIPNEKINLSFNYHQMIEDVTLSLFTLSQYTKSSEKLEIIKNDLRGNGSELKIESVGEQNDCDKSCNSEPSPLKTSIGSRRNSLLSTSTYQSTDEPILLGGKSSPDLFNSRRRASRSSSRSPDVRRKEKEDFQQNSEIFRERIRRNSIHDILQSDDLGGKYLPLRRKSVSNIESKIPMGNHISTLWNIPEDPELKELSYSR